MAVPQKKKPSAAFSILTPSAMGMIMYSSFGVLLIFLHQIEAIEQYLQVPGNFELGPFVMRSLDSLLTSSIGEERTQSLVVGTFWAFVGLGVYILLQGIARFIVEMGEGMDQRKFVWPRGTNRYRPLLEAIERGIFRVIATIALVIAVVGPISQVLSGPVFVDFIGPSLPLQLIIWFMAIWVMLHVCVVLARLIALKPRLLG